MKRALRATTLGKEAEKEQRQLLLHSAEVAYKLAASRVRVARLELEYAQDEVRRRIADLDNAQRECEYALAELHMTKEHAA